MVLVGVEYELFDWEAEWYDQHPVREFDELHGQLRMHLADQRTLYVAWDSDDRTFYKVAYGETSFCQPHADAVLTVSGSRLWRPLVGGLIELSYLDQAQQVLAIRGGNSVVYCCSYHDGLWGTDLVRVTDTVPGPVPRRDDWPE